MPVGGLSDSGEPRDAEPLILEAVSRYLGQSLESKTVHLETGAPVQVDGVAGDFSAFVEIYAHHGPLKGGQQKKVSNDALKLITLGRAHPEAKLIIAFADEEASRYATKGTWVSEALATWKVEVLVVEIDAEVRHRIRAAQVRQQMVNPAAQAPEDAIPD